MLAAKRCVEPLANPTRALFEVAVRHSRRVFHAYLVRVCEHWVVQVPDARGVHAIVLDLSDAEEVARAAIAVVLDLEPSSIRVVLDRHAALPIASAPLTAGRPLTRREREVLEQAALGMSNRQIGQQLEIAEQTVKNHLSSAMRKLSLHDRMQAVVVGLGQGLISLPVGGDPERADALRSTPEGVALKPSSRPQARPDVS